MTATTTREVAAQIAALTEAEIETMMAGDTEAAQTLGASIWGLDRNDNDADWMQRALGNNDAGALLRAAREIAGA